LGFDLLGDEFKEEERDKGLRGPGGVGDVEVGRVDDVPEGANAKGENWWWEEEFGGVAKCTGEVKG